eukprot:Polyplicarium_translucidae@DN1871_c0_g1_i2.p1
MHIRIFAGSWNTEYNSFDSLSLRDVKHTASETPSEARLRRSFGTDEETDRDPDSESPGTDWDSSESDVIGLSALRWACQPITPLGSPAGNSSGSSETPVHHGDTGLGEWIRPDHEVYVVALQELATDRLVRMIDDYIHRAHPHRRFELFRRKERDVIGRGDGAFLRIKRTAIMCWVDSELLHRGLVRVGPFRSQGLSPVGCKGLAALMMSMCGQVLLFLGCHLPSRRPAERLDARQKLQRQLLEQMAEGNFAQPPRLVDAFHHVVWMGDFNARLQNLKAAKAVEMLKLGHVQALFSFDEFQQQEWNWDMKSDQFEESEVTFLPTYKKSPMRRLQPHSCKVEDEYALQYRSQWYKGGRTRHAVPSWCDRILIRSAPDVRGSLSADANTYR